MNALTRRSEYFLSGVGATVANRSSVLDSADDNCSNASVSSDADEKMILGGQLYVSFPERNSDAHEDGNETVRRVTRHSKSLPVEAHSNIGKTAPYQDRSSPKEALSYKETLFEKIILAPVVNVRDLRKLGWNGESPRSKYFSIIFDIDAIFFTCETIHYCKPIAYFFHQRYTGKKQL